MNTESPPYPTSSSHKPPSRSCKECYRRKLKCDRAQTCSNCLRGCLTCVYTNEPIRRDRKSKRRAQESAKDTTPVLQPRPGRFLAGKHGKSRLLGDTCWARPFIEPVGLNDGQNDPTYHLPPSGTGNLFYENFLFRKTAPRVPIEIANPSFCQIRQLWDIYVHNVDPLVKILHKPSVERVLCDLSLSEDGPDPEIWALLLAICYAAVSSLPSSQIRVEFALDADNYVASFRAALEKALTDAQLLQTHDLRVIQAFAIYLTCLPRKEARSIALLISLAVRISRTMGLHRDGSIFKLPTFETEMRRRLWWYLCLLDWRAAEDAGLEITIMLSTFDTKMPLNINDDDMDITSSDIHGRHDYTEMAFSLIRYEAWSVLASWSSMNMHQEPAGIEEKKRAIENLSTYLENTYINPYCQISTPFTRILLMVTPLLMDKLRLIIMYPAYCDGTNGEVSLTLEDKNKLFRSAIDLLEFEQTLGADYELRGWRWFFANAHIQWHAMTFVLSELCVRVEGEVEHMAWDVIERVFPSTPDRRDDNVWEPLQGLKQKALSTRYSITSQLSALFPSDTDDFVLDRSSLDWSW
ncbi:fungal-specific transcription factor domain-containing protein [Annulohypoxylon truncatum]|uniref:fungal-specific transcription factor domain-containing protein n=1 Tax=Annulohypoxylon truncatum TaxID=327061 RepID=UPI00200773D9|nr:fungal-specific transcription factor domain-containing protein [Annulohypoxylon truncatum]KAI1210427.1 fungal-specific transcription factor domain-containing protein [Annulohypoxylon truncatum]